MDSPALQLSVVIVNWNTRELLRACLESVRQHTGGITYEIIVVDNDSHDGSPAMVRQQFPYWRLIENTENLGFAAAVNLALAADSAPLVALVNDDALLAPGWLAATRAELGPEVAAVQGAHGLPTRPDWAPPMKPKLPYS